MRPIGPILKAHIEGNELKKGEIANKVGITYNYLSTIFNKTSIDASLLEKLCVAANLNPMVFFETSADMATPQISDIKATTLVGNAAVQIGTAAHYEQLLSEKDRLIAEKERTIQILLQNAGLKAVPESGQK